MNGRMITKMAIVAGAFFFLVWCGVKAGRWADEQSKATETRFIDAIKVLQSN